MLTTASALKSFMMFWSAVHQAYDKLNARMLTVPRAHQIATQLWNYELWYQSRNEKESNGHAILSKFRWWVVLKGLSSCWPPNNTSPCNVSRQRKHTQLAESQWLPQCNDPNHTPTTPTDSWLVDLLYWPNNTGLYLAAIRNKRTKITWSRSGPWGANLSPR